MQELDQKLMQYGRTDMYPFHMPGHKRQGLPFADPYEIDITEIDGFDNLHHAQGILREAQQRAAELYGARKSYYLINGSTCGILAAVCAATQKGDKILIARNCHKAVYHAAYLNELFAEYLYPAINEFGIQGEITPEQVEEALRRHPDVAAVLITSPTYEGVVSDIKGIAAVAHAHGVPLIVDEAHGAHLGFSEGFPQEAGKQGADLVIMSLHKTLPSFTQTALLHIFSNRISAERVEKYLDIFETSSPSYVLMAGMEQCIRFIREKKDVLFSEYEKQLQRFYQRTSGLRKLHVLRREDFAGCCHDWDPSKIVIFSKEKDYDGTKLSAELRDQYHLEPEMTSAEYVLAMTSVMDTEEGFDRLAEALAGIDERLARENGSGGAARPDGSIDTARPSGATDADTASMEHLVAAMYQPRRREMQIAQAENFPAKEVSFEEAEGEVSAGYIYLYPPGIPIVVPGEVLDGTLLCQIERCMELGLTVEGAKNIGSKRINIVYF